MGRFFTSVFLILVLLVAAVLILPSFVDWTQFRAQIETQASRVTGRDIAIGGDIEFRLLPSPEMALGDVSVSNKGEAATPLLSADRIEAVAAWGPLFAGEVEIRRLHLVEPVARLEIDEAGKTNWRPGTWPDPSQPTAPGASRFLRFWSFERIAFTDVTFDDGLLFYADARTGAQDQIEDITGRVALQSLAGPGEGDVLFEIAGEPMRLGFLFGPIPVGDGAAPLNMKLGFENGPAELEFDGRARGLDAARQALATAPVTFDGTLKAEAASAGPMADGLVALITFGRPHARAPSVLPAGVGALPATGGAGLMVTSDEIAIQDLALTLGQTKWTGELIRSRTNNSVSGTMTTDLIYLDELRPSGGEAARGRVPALVVPGIDGPLRLLGSCECQGDLSLTAEKLLLDNVSFGPLSAAAEFDSEIGPTTRIELALPGETAFSAAGRIGASETQSALLTGSINLKSDQARMFLSWLDVDIGAVEPSKLKSFDLSGELLLADRAAVTGAGLRTGETRSLVVADIPQATLILDGASYDVALAANPVPPTSLRLKFVGGEFDAAAYGLLGALWPEAPLDVAAWGETGLGRAGRFDALDLHIELEALGLGRRTANDFALAIDRSADGLALARLDVREFAGYGIKLDGSRQVDADAGVPLSKGRLRVSGGRDAGFVLPFAEQPLSREIDLDATYEEVPGKAAFKLDGVAGDMVLMGEAAGTPRGQLIADFDTLELSATMKEGRAILGGSLSGLSGLPVFDGNLTVDALSFPSYVRALGYDYEPRRRDLGALSVVAELGYSSEALRVPRFAASVGDQTATGNLEMKLGGERGVLDMGLNLGEVSLNGFLPKPDSGLLWSTDEITLDVLERADGDIRLGAERLEVYGLNLKGVSADLGLKDGVLSGQAMTASLFGGALSLTGSVGSRDGVVSLTGQGGLSNFDLEKAAQVLAPNLGITGYGDATFDASAKGTTQFMLAQSVSGEGTLKGGAGRLQGFDLATWSAGLGKVQSPERFLRLVKDTLSAGASPFNGFSGRITADVGALRAQDFTIDFDKASAKLTGTLSLPTKSEALRLRLDLKERTDLPPATLVYTGPIADPQLTYDIANLQKVMLAQFEASGAGRISVEDLPPDLQELLEDEPAN